MSPAFLLVDVASELALFAAAGFLLFAIDDLAVDLIYFGRRLWRAITVYSRYPRAFAGSIMMLWKPRFIAIFVPAWDESAVIDAMLTASLHRFDRYGGNSPAESVFGEECSPAFTASMPGRA